MGEIPNQKSVCCVGHKISVFAHDANFINLRRQNIQKLLLKTNMKYCRILFTGFKVLLVKTFHKK